MKPIMIKCECCGGTGKRPLSDDMLETLEAVRHLKNAHAAQVCKAIGFTCSQEAMSNRLADLMRLGFLTRNKSGKFWVYSCLIWSQEETASLKHFYEQGWVYEFPGWEAMARMVNDLHGNNRTASECEAEYTRYCDSLRVSHNGMDEGRRTQKIETTTDSL